MAAGAQESHQGRERERMAESTVPELCRVRDAEAERDDVEIGQRGRDNPRRDEPGRHGGAPPARC